MEKTERNFSFVMFALCLIGVFVIGPGNQGVLMEHRELEFGHHANMTDILEAIKKGNEKNQ